MWTGSRGHRVYGPGPISGEVVQSLVWVPDPWTNPPSEDVHSCRVGPSHPGGWCKDSAHFSLLGPDRTGTRRSPSTYPSVDGVGGGEIRGGIVPPAEDPREGKSDRSLGLTVQGNGSREAVGPGVEAVEVQGVPTSPIETLGERSTRRDEGRDRGSP